MRNYLLGLLALLTITACGPQREVIQILKGDPGTSCTVAPELDSETSALIGSRISCTDGSSSIILNGAQGPQGIQGVQGATGAQGVAGQNGQSCSVSRAPHSDYATVSCPHSAPVKIYDGQDGEDGRNGTSCSVAQVSGGARITCGNTVAFVANGVNGINGMNGTNGANGTSCSISNVDGGAKITCGSTSQMVYDGTNGHNGAVGPTGPQGPAGPQGQPGAPGENALANAIGIKGYIYPCGVEFNNDEIFLRLTDGKILAVYDGSTAANPDLSRLALLAPGSYRTTDRLGTQCLLSVDNNLNVDSTPQTTGLRLNN
jgi:hypothetical protein